MSMTGWLSCSQGRGVDAVSSETPRKGTAQQRGWAMNSSVSLYGPFRHVIFPGEVRRRQQVVNLAASPDVVAAGEPTPPGLSEEQADFLQWLFQQADLRLSLYRPETLLRRLPACLRALRARTPAQARCLLEQNRELLPVALDAMLVGVTWFFRDVGVFDMLREYVLPALAEGRRGLHVWSVGCSEGAELYSVALLLAERRRLDASYLLGTDCRPEAIRRARAGLFDAEAIKHVPPDLLGRYFLRQPGGWQVVPSVQAALHWRTADVLATVEPGVWDLILCRNTTMYLKAEATALLWQEFESLLRPGGVLVLGKAERPVGAGRLSLLGPCLYRRTRG